MPSFEELYARYFADVYRYIFSLCGSESTAEEITQETFFRALQGIDSFDGRCKVYVWLCQIAKNLYFSTCRRQVRHIPLDTLPDAPSPGEGDSVFGRESLEELCTAIHSLEEPGKEVVMLKVFGELKFAQIGQLFGKTESWARVTFYRSKIKLKEMLE